jgi:CubicO group peptidase (beta-lactamase class C family)
MKFSQSAFLFSFCLFSACILSAQSKNSKKAALPAPLPAAVFEEYIQREAPRRRAPGFSVAVVKDGKIVFNKGYGVRELGKPDAFGTGTLAEAASTTKAMTAMCLALLVEEGKLRWTDKVVDVYPGFALYDPHATREVTVRDLLTHSAGLGNADFLWYGNSLSQEEMVRRLRYLPPAYSLRSSYTYQNVMYVAAGKLIEKTSGRTWEDFMTERIFKPLGMNRSYPTYSYSKAETDRTAQHFEINDTVQVIPVVHVDAAAPAGAVWTCSDDMAKWMLFLLDSTKTPDGKRWLNAAGFGELFKPQHLIPREQFYPTARLTKPNWTTYGLGWFQHDYRGRMVQFHTGSIDGAVAIVGLIPEERTGICVFANLDHDEFRHALMYKAFDLWAFGDSRRDWSAEFFDLYNNLKAEAKQKEAEKLAKRMPDAQTSAPFSAYAGRYSDPLYGEVEVTFDGRKLLLRLNDLRMTLEHWHFDTFRGHYERRWAGRDWVQFSLDPDGKVAELNIDRMHFRRSER